MSSVEARSLRFAVISLAALVAVALAAAASFSQPNASAGASPGQHRALTVYAKFPASFVPNVGQLTTRSVRYSAQGAGYGFAFARNHVVLSFVKRGNRVALSLRFLGASRSVKLVAGAKLRGTANYFLGPDPARWRTGVPTYRVLVYRGLWRGVDLQVRAEPGRLKYEFHVRAGADPNSIRLGYQGARRLSLTRTGALAIPTPLGPLTDARPASYQIVGAEREPVESAYVLHGNGRYGFALGRYDTHRPLVIDPGIEYSTYLGGNDGDEATRIAVEGGYAYVSGCTASDDFPTTRGAFQTVHNPGGDFPCDAFVSKLAKDGSALVYSTYIGGSETDVGYGTVEAGRVYLTGFTASADFPTTSDAFQPTYGGGGHDGFVSELSKDGSALVYSTYLGGSGPDQGNDIEVEGGNAYVAGNTESTDFPTTAGAFQQTGRGGPEVFVTKLAAGGSTLGYSTLLGGSDDEESEQLAVEGGRAYVTGLTRSSDFPTTPGAFQTGYAGGDDDAFVTKLARDGSALDYSTFLGGSSGDHGVGIALGGSFAYLTGITGSTDFPTTSEAFQRAYGGGFRDVFVTKLDGHGAALVYSTYLGGHSNDNGLAIAVEGGRACVTGRTGSNSGGPGENDFPTTADAVQPVFGGSFDAFVTKLAGDGSSLSSSTYLGGSDFDEGLGVAVEGNRAYVAGGAGSGFPTTARAFQPAYGGGFSDAFVTRLHAK